MSRALALLLVGIFVIHCSPEHRQGAISGGSDTEKADDALGGGGVSLNPNAIPYSEVVAKVLEPAGCFDCHGKFRKHETVMKTVDLSLPPEKTKLYLRASTDMPPIEEGYLPLSEEQLQLIRDWIADGANP